MFEKRQSSSDKSALQNSPPGSSNLISPMQLGMHIVRVVVIDANHTYAHTKGPSEGIENKTSASFKYAMTFSCQDKRGLVPTRPKPLSMILLVLDELKLCFQPMQCTG